VGRVPEYLAERYEPGVTRERIEADAARLALASRELRAEGHAIEFLGSTFVPGDEASLSRFTSSSADLVETVHRRASVPVERVVEGFAVAGEQGREEVSTSIQRRSVGVSPHPTKARTEGTS
jgi:hypothetical protein